MGTVSRVLNRHPSVNPAIRRVVLQSIEELQFRPSPIARALSTARTRTLGLLLPSMRNADLVSAMLEGAEAAAHEYGYTLFILDSRGDPRIEQQHLRNLLDRRVDGLICTPSAAIGGNYEHLRAMNIPIVALTPPTTEGLVHEVVLNFGEATEAAIDHLVALGHRRIGTITLAGPSSLDASVGWGVRFIQHALRKRGIDADPSLHPIAASTEECHRIVREMVAGDNRPTALLVTPLYLVPATVTGIRAAGASVPRDVSLIGFGDSEWAEALDPPLSVVAADLTPYLSAATRLLIALIEGNGDGVTAVESHARYIRRGSVAACSGEAVGNGQSVYRPDGGARAAR